MYRSPDFVKVDLDIKDNFAAYEACYERTYVGNIIGHCDVVGDPTYNFQTLTEKMPQAPYQCLTKEV